MVRIPETPPDWQKILKQHSGILEQLSQNEAVRAILDKAQIRYDHWEKIRFQAVPSGIDHSHVWAYLKFIRSHGQHALSMHDIQGKVFTYSPTERLSQDLQRIEEALRGHLYLEGEEVSVKLYTKSLMEEAITSSQIEGAVGTIKEGKEMLLSGRKPRTTSERMIYNNFVTMQSLKEFCGEDLSHGLLFDIHASITSETLQNGDEVGRYRKESERVRIETMQGDVLFIPPKASEIEARLEALFEFANDGDVPLLHPIVKGILLHFWLAYIHPFVDGNGRVARALFYWYMLKKGYWLFEYLSISRSILRKSSQYAKAYLYTQTDGGDATYFIAFNIRVILEAIGELEAYLGEERRRDQEAQIEATRVPGLNLRQARIVHHALSHPYESYTIRMHQVAQGIAYQTARSDLLGLAEKGLLRKVQRGKAFAFVPVDGLRQIVGR